MKALGLLFIWPVLALLVYFSGNFIVHQVFNAKEYTDFFTFRSSLGVAACLCILKLLFSK